MSKLGRVLVVLVSTKVAWGQCVDLTLTLASLPAGQQGAAYAGATFGATGATLRHLHDGESVTDRDDAERG